VQAGAALMRDARRPAILFAAHVSGRVAKIERGARRRLVSVQIEVDETLAAAGVEAPSKPGRESARAFMLESGAWTSLRTRPFGNVPHPDGEPAAIFVTAIDAQPQAPDPRPLIESFGEEFRAAVEMLTRISEAPLYVCHAPQYRPDIDETDRLRCVVFSGGEAAGLPGIHIAALCPIGFSGGEVWHLGYQDAIALGHSILHATPWLQRMISLGGNAVRNPRSLLLPPGAAIGELLAGELLEVPNQVIAGSALFGRVLDNSEGFLGAGLRQLTVVDATQGKIGPAGSDGVVIPGDRLEGVAPPGVLPVPMMRALQLGDAERARELGALELVEEDVALLSRACLSNNDYGRLLRGVLDQLEAAGG
jgi:Na+-transporting NADH:ubiquinone oxidoreductase subunit A